MGRQEKKTDNREMKNREKKQNTTNKSDDFSPNLSIITLNAGGLNTQSKRQMFMEWFIQYDPTICYPQKTHFKYSNIGKLKVKEWKR